MKLFQSPLRLSRLSLAMMAALAFLLIASSCKREDPTDPTTDPTEATLKMGNLDGRVYTQSGKRKVPNAIVFVDQKGSIYSTRTDADGKFNLRVPEGDHVLNIQSGHGDIFRSTLNVSVTADQTTYLPPNQTQLKQQGDLAYIQGSFDNIETILVDTLGYSATEIVAADLDNLSNLTQFSAIFLNCGKWDMLDSTRYSNLYNFVMGGGSLYASDWGVEYLTGDGNFRLAGPGGHHAVPHRHEAQVDPNQRAAGCTPELGGFIADSDLCSDKSGPTTWVMGANVVAADIQVVTGPTMDIEYDLGGWEVIGVLGSSWEVLVSDPVNYGPLAIRLEVSGSTVGFDPSITSGSNPTGGVVNNGWVTICHIPPGNPANPQTITISASALQTHLNHGDTLGPCGGGNGARIYYTTFHNHVNTALSPDMKAILEYFVLNL